MRKKRGFVLMEAIVVITVLSVILVMLYGSYSKILIDVQKQSLYDNTEYIYKTNIVRDIVEKESPDYEGSIITTFCSESTSSCNLKGQVFVDLRVKAVYITTWNISASDARSLEATTQRYIKSIDEFYNDSLYRIIVMYDQENNETDKPVYEYASLRFGSRG